MTAGKLTIQAWHDAREREAERERLVQEITREAAKLIVMLTPRRRQSMWRRFVRSLTV